MRPSGSTSDTSSEQPATSVHGRAAPPAAVERVADRFSSVLIECMARISSCVLLCAPAARTCIAVWTAGRTTAKLVKSRGLVRLCCLALFAAFAALRSILAALRSSRRDLSNGAGFVIFEEI